MRYAAVLLALMLLVPQSALAVITFTQLDDDVFTVSHRVKAFGLRGKAVKLVNTKAASLCIAAGFSHMKILDQESETGQADDSANASIRTQFFFEDGEGRLGCERNATTEYIKQAEQKLAEQGYQPPDRSSVRSQDSTGSPLESSSCTIEQIAAMARSGLTDGQIRAACNK